jgi:Phage tail tube protein
MAFLQGSRSGLSHITEVTYGTTPATPTFIEIPYTSHSLNLSKERVSGRDLQVDRMLRVDRHGNRSAAGDVVVDMRNGNYDSFLESAFMSTWAANVLKIGTTLKSFSIEDSANDTASTDAFRLFTGMAVSKYSCSIKPNNMVTGTFSFMGKDMVAALTKYETTLTPGAINKPYDAYSGTIKIADAGSALVSVAQITGIDFTVDNSFNPTYVVGSPTTPQLEYGMANVTGTVTAYFEDLSLINRFINEVETGFEVQVDSPDVTAGQTYLFPRIKINAADVPVDNPQSRIITLPFQALYDTTENTSIKITRLT